MARKYGRKFVRGHYLLLEANSFPRPKLEENCELRGTDNVQGQISEHIFTPNGNYCLCYPSNLFRNARSLENWGIFGHVTRLGQSRVSKKICWIIIVIIEYSEILAFFCYSAIRIQIKLYMYVCM